MSCEDPAPMTDIPLIADAPLPLSREELRQGLADGLENRTFRMFAGANTKAIMHAIREVIVRSDAVADEVLARIQRS